MIDCKECIHFDICKSCGILTGRLTSCPTFKHSSKFVELPCDIGDVFYEPHIYSMRHDLDEVWEERVSGLQKKADGTWKVRLSTKYGVYDIKATDIGKIVFKTYEEAEKELVRLQND